jgi:hypothetical protein
MFAWCDIILHSLLNYSNQHRNVELCFENCNFGSLTTITEKYGK